MISVLAPDCIYLLDTFDYDPMQYSGKCTNSINVKYLVFRKIKQNKSFI